VLVKKQDRKYHQTTSRIDTGTENHCFNGRRTPFYPDGPGFGDRLTFEQLLQQPQSHLSGDRYDAFTADERTALFEARKRFPRPIETNVARQGQTAHLVAALPLVPGDETSSDSAVEQVDAALTRNPVPSNPQLQMATGSDGQPYLRLVD
jgi:hypothetical protein